MTDVSRSVLYPVEGARLVIQLFVFGGQFDVRVV